MTYQLCRFEDATLIGPKVEKLGLIVTLGEQSYARPAVTPNLNYIPIPPLKLKSKTSSHEYIQADIIKLSTIKSTKPKYKACASAFLTSMDLRHAEANAALFSIPIGSDCAFKFKPVLYSPSHMLESLLDPKDRKKAMNDLISLLKLCDERPHLNTKFLEYLSFPPLMKFLIDTQMAIVSDSKARSNYEPFFEEFWSSISCSQIKSKIIEMDPDILKTCLHLLIQDQFTNVEYYSTCMMLVKSLVLTKIANRSFGQLLELLELSIQMNYKIQSSSLYSSSNKKEKSSSKKSLSKSAPTSNLHSLSNSGLPSPYDSIAMSLLDCILYYDPKIIPKVSNGLCIIAKHIMQKHMQHSLGVLSRTLNVIKWLGLDQLSVINSHKLFDEVMNMCQTRKGESISLDGIEVLRKFGITDSSVTVKSVITLIRESSNFNQIMKNLTKLEELVSSSGLERKDTIVVLDTLLALHRHLDDPLSSFVERIVSMIPPPHASPSSSSSLLLYAASNSQPWMIFIDCNLFDHFKALLPFPSSYGYQHAFKCYITAWSSVFEELNGIDSDMLESLQYLQYLSPPLNPLQQNQLHLQSSQSASPILNQSIFPSSFCNFCDALVKSGILETLEFQLLTTLYWNQENKKISTPSASSSKSGLTSSATNVSQPRPLSSSTSTSSALKSSQKSSFTTASSFGFGRIRKLDKLIISQPFSSTSSQTLDQHLSQPHNLDDLHVLYSPLLWLTLTLMRLSTPVRNYVQSNTRLFETIGLYLAEIWNDSTVKYIVNQIPSLTLDEASAPSTHHHRHNQLQNFAEKSSILWTIMATHRLNTISYTQTSIILTRNDQTHPFEPPKYWQNPYDDMESHQPQIISSSVTQLANFNLSEKLQIILNRLNSSWNNDAYATNKAANNPDKPNGLFFSNPNQNKVLYINNVPIRSLEPSTLAWSNLCKAALRQLIFQNQGNSIHEPNSTQPSLSNASTSDKSNKHSTAGFSTTLLSQSIRLFRVFNIQESIFPCFELYQQADYCNQNSQLDTLSLEYLLAELCVLNCCVSPVSTATLVSLKPQLVYFMLRMCLSFFNRHLELQTILNDDDEPVVISARDPSRPPARPTKSTSVVFNPNLSGHYHSTIIVEQVQLSLLRCLEYFYCDTLDESIIAQIGTNNSIPPSTFSYLPYPYPPTILKDATKKVIFRKDLAPLISKPSNSSNPMKHSSRPVSAKALEDANHGQPINLGSTSTSPKSFSKRNLSKSMKVSDPSQEAPSSSPKKSKSLKGLKHSKLNASDSPIVDKFESTPDSSHPSASSSNQTQDTVITPNTAPVNPDELERIQLRKDIDGLLEGSQYSMYKKWLFPGQLASPQGSTPRFSDIQPTNSSLFHLARCYFRQQSSSHIRLLWAPESILRIIAHNFHKMKQNQNSGDGQKEVSSSSPQRSESSSTVTIQAAPMNAISSPLISDNYKPLPTLVDEIPAFVLPIASVTRADGETRVPWSLLHADELLYEYVMWVRKHISWIMSKVRQAAAELQDDPQPSERAVLEFINQNPWLSLISNYIQLAFCLNYQFGEFPESEDFVPRNLSTQSDMASRVMIVEDILDTLYEMQLDMESPAVGVLRSNRAAFFQVVAISPFERLATKSLMYWTLLLEDAVYNHRPYYADMSGTANTGAILTLCRHEYQPALLGRFLNVMAEYCIMLGRQEQRFCRASWIASAGTILMRILVEMATLECDWERWLRYNLWIDTRNYHQDKKTLDQLFEPPQTESKLIDFKTFQSFRKLKKSDSPSQKTQREYHQHTVSEDIFDEYFEYRLKEFRKMLKQNRLSAPQLKEHLNANTFLRENQDLFMYPSNWIRKLPLEFWDTSKFHKHQTMADFEKLNYSLPTNGKLFSDNHEEVTSFKSKIMEQFRPLIEACWKWTSREWSKKTHLKITSTIDLKEVEALIQHFSIGGHSTTPRGSGALGSMVPGNLPQISYLAYLRVWNIPSLDWAYLESVVNLGVIIPINCQLLAGFHLSKLLTFFEPQLVAISNICLQIIANGSSPYLQSPASSSNTNTASSSAFISSLEELQRKDFTKSPALFSFADLISMPKKMEFDVPLWDGKESMNQVLKSICWIGQYLPYYTLQIGVSAGLLNDGAEGANESGVPLHIRAVLPILLAQVELLVKKLRKKDLPAASKKSKKPSKSSAKTKPSEVEVDFKDISSTDPSIQNPETISQQLELADKEFWEKGVQANRKSFGPSSPSSPSSSSPSFTHSSLLASSFNNGTNNTNHAGQMDHRRRGGAGDTNQRNNRHQQGIATTNNNNNTNVNNDNNNNDAVRTVYLNEADIAKLRRATKEAESGETQFVQAGGTTFVIVAPMNVHPDLANGLDSHDDGKLVKRPDLSRLLTNQASQKTIMNKDPWASISDDSPSSSSSVSSSSKIISPGGSPKKHDSKHFVEVPNPTGKKDQPSNNNSKSELDLDDIKYLAAALEMIRSLVFGYESWACNRIIHSIRKVAELCVDYANVLTAMQRKTLSANIVAPLLRTLSLLLAQVVIDLDKVEELLQDSVWNTFVALYLWLPKDFRTQRGLVSLVSNYYVKRLHDHPERDMKIQFQLQLALLYLLDGPRVIDAFEAFRGIMFKIFSTDNKTSRDLLSQILDRLSAQKPLDELSATVLYRLICSPIQQFGNTLICKKWLYRFEEMCSKGVSDTSLSVIVLLVARLLQIPKPQIPSLILSISYIAAHRISYVSRRILAKCPSYKTELSFNIPNDPSGQPQSIRSSSSRNFFKSSSKDSSNLKQSQATEDRNSFWSDGPDISGPSDTLKKLKVALADVPRFYEILHPKRYKTPYSTSCGRLRSNFPIIGNTQSISVGVFLDPVQVWMVPYSSIVSMSPSENPKKGNSFLKKSSGSKNSSNNGGAGSANNNNPIGNMDGMMPSSSSNPFNQIERTKADLAELRLRRLHRSFGTDSDDDDDPNGLTSSDDDDEEDESDITISDELMEDDDTEVGRVEGRSRNSDLGIGDFYHLDDPTLHDFSDEAPNMNIDGPERSNLTESNYNHHTLEHPSPSSSSAGALQIQAHSIDSNSARINGPTDLSLNEASSKTAFSENIEAQSQKKSKKRKSKRKNQLHSSSSSQKPPPMLNQSSSSGMSYKRSIGPLPTGISNRREPRKSHGFIASIDNRKHQVGTHMRIGWATQSAIKKLNSDPYLILGDIPGTFALAPDTGALYCEGSVRYLLSRDYSWYHMAWNSLSSWFDVEERHVAFLLRGEPQSFHLMSSADHEIYLRIPIPQKYCLANQRRQAQEIHINQWTLEDTAQQSSTNSSTKAQQPATHTPCGRCDLGAIALLPDELIPCVSLSSTRLELTLGTFVRTHNLPPW